SSERVSASSRSWVTSRTLMVSRSTSATRSFTTRARTIASSEANGSSMRRSRGFIASTCASATRLRWPPLRRRGKRSPKPARSSRSSQASASASAFLRSMPLKVRPRATLSRAVFHGSRASSWKRIPTYDRARPVSTVPASGSCSPITARNRLDLPRARRPDQAHETAVAHGEARSLEDRLSAIGNRQITDAQDSTPDDRSVVQPGHARARLDEAGGDQALLDALCRVEVDGHRLGVERVAVTGDDLAELLEVEPGGH